MGKDVSTKEEFSLEWEEKPLSSCGVIVAVLARTVWMWVLLW